MTRHEHELADETERCLLQVRSTATDLERLRSSFVQSLRPDTKFDATITLARLIALASRVEIRAERILIRHPRGLTGDRLLMIAPNPGS